MQMYSAINYLKGIKIVEIQNKNRFVNQFDVEISSPGKRKRLKTHNNVKNINQAVQMGTRLFQLFSHPVQINEEFQCLINRLIQVIFDDPQTFQQLCKQYKTILVQLGAIFLQIIHKDPSFIKKTLNNSLLDILQIMYTELSQPFLFQTFVGFTLLYSQKCIEEEQSGQIVLAFSYLIRKLQLIQDKFIKINEQFKMTQKIIENTYKLFFWYSIRQTSAQNSQIKQKQQQTTDISSITISNKIKNNKQFQRIWYEYLKFLKFQTKYSLIDPQYHIIILDIMHKFINKYDLDNQITSKMITQKLATILQLEAKKLFLNYDQEIIRETDSIIKLNKNEKFIQKLLQKFQNADYQFIIENIKWFQELFSFRQYQSSVFYILYNSTNKVTIEKNDKKIINLLVRWNLMFDFMPCNQFMHFMAEDRLEYISKQTEAVISENKSQLAGLLLDSILKLKVHAYSPQKQHIDSKFIKHEVLHKNQRPYTLYTVMLIKILTNPSLDFQHINFNEINQIGIIGDQQRVMEVKQCMRFLFKTAQRNNIYHFEFIEYAFILCSLLETQSTLVDSDDYIAKYFNNALEITGQQELVKLNQKLVRIFLITGNKIPTYYSFYILLKILKDGQSQKIVLKTLRNFESEYRQSQYSKIMSFSGASLKILILIYLKTLHNQGISKLTKSILCLWCNLYSSYQIQLLLYNFDISFFKEIAKLLGKKFEHKQCLISTLSLLFDLLSEQYNNPVYLKNAQDFHILQPSNNQFQIIFIKVDTRQLTQSPRKTKNYSSLKFGNRENQNIILKFWVFGNWNCNKQSCIDFYSSGDLGLHRHRLYFKYGVMHFCDRISKKVITVENNSESKAKNNSQYIVMSIQNSKLRVFSNKKQIIYVQFPYFIQNIKFQLNGDLLISDLSWSYGFAQRKITNDFDYKISPYQAEVRMTKSHGITLKSFNKKVKISYLCAYLLKILEYNYQQLNLNQYYTLSFILILKGIDIDSNLATQSKVQQNRACSLINYLFKKISEAIVNSNNQLTVPNLQSLSKQFDKIQPHKLFFTTLLSAIFNDNFFIKVSFADKNKIVSYLQDLINKNYQFLQVNQNKRMGIFVTIFTICQKLLDLQNTQQITQKLVQIAKNILHNHLLNKVLMDKVKYLLYIYKDNPVKQIKKYAKQIITDLLLIDGTQEQAKSHHKKITDFIILQCHQISLIVGLLDDKYKTKILDYLINLHLITKCQSLLNQLTSEQYLELNDWIICAFKRFTFEFFQLNKKNQQSTDSLIFFMKSIIKLKKLVGQIDNEQEQNIDEILSNFFIQLTTKSLGQENSYNIIKWYQIASDPLFTEMLINQLSKAQSITRNCSSPVKSAKKIKRKNKIMERCFKFVFQLPKKYLFESLENLRKQAAPQIQILQQLFKMQCVKELKVYALSIFLQITIQFLVVLQQNFLKQSMQYAIIGQTITKYISWLLLQSDKQSHQKQMKNIFIYVYPILEHSQHQSNKQIKKKLYQVRQGRNLELGGGIYFKLLCIVSKLIQMYHNIDYSDEISFLLNDICHNSLKKMNLEKNAILRAISDFKQVSKDVKERTQIHLMIKQNQAEHFLYHQKFDALLDPKKSESFKVKDKDKNKIMQKKSMSIDLTPFYIDYFLMKLCLFLENNSDSKDEKTVEIAKIYSSLLFKHLEKFERIEEEMTQNNVDYPITFESVEDLMAQQEIEGSQKFETVTDGVNCPKSPKNSIPFDDPNVEIDHMFLSPKKKKASKEKHSIFEKITSKKKKRAALINNLEKDLQTWILEAKPKKFHRYFRNQSKNILLIELIHSYYTLYSGQGKIAKIGQKRKKMQLLLNGFDQSFSTIQSDSNRICSDMLKKIQIRKVFPYTASEVPMLEVQQKSLPNLSKPFIKLGTFIKQEESNGVKSIWKAQNYSDIMLQGTFTTESAINPLKKKLSKQDEICVCQVQEQELQNNFCQISFRNVVYFCQWQILSGQIILKTKQQKIVQDPQMKQFIKRGTPISNIKGIHNKIIEIKPQKITQIIYRKFNQIKNIALEFFLRDGTQFILILYTEEKVTNFVDLCKHKWVTKDFDKFKHIKIIRDSIQQFYNQRFTQQWVNGQIDNFDYLMFVNKYSGRSFADLSQYYIFPWVLQNYTDKHINLSDHKNYRDLKKPVGALNPQKLSRYLEKMVTSSVRSQSDIGQKYLYGSHYSTSLFVLYYLVRIEPFTTLHKDMQSGEFDSPDRIFSSIQVMWDSLMNQSNSSDIKQSIPEFYYSASFLKNMNSLDLGMKQSQIQVNDVELPPWAHNSPERFIMIMRAALESDYVSTNLNHWIDLIFGKYQNSFDKHNVFHPYSYCQKIKPSQIQSNRLEGVMSHIYYFGQNPYALFKKEHPSKRMKIHTLLIDRESRSSYCDEQVLQKNLYVKEVKASIQPLTLRMKEKQIEIIIGHIGKPSEYDESVILNMSQKSPHTLVRRIQNRNKQKKLSINRIKSMDCLDLIKPSLTTINAEIIHESQIKIKLKTEKWQQTLHTMKVDTKLSKFRMNQIYFATFGVSGYGLTLYDWSLDVFARINPHNGHICECFLSKTHLFYLITNGELYLYDFLKGQNQLIYEFQNCKSIKAVKMFVYRQNRLPTKKNEINYKFLLIGDLRHIAIVNYTHKIQ